jgi:hypothetical protein
MNTSHATGFDNVDVELGMLCFCDVTSVMQYSYCNRQKYQLVHNSQ